MISKKGKLWEFFSADYYRCTGKELTRRGLFKLIFSRRNLTVKYLFFWRSSSLSTSWIWKRVAVRVHRSLSYKLSFEIPTDVKIGKGLRLVHFGGGGSIKPFSSYR